MASQTWAGFFEEIYKHLKGEHSTKHFTLLQRFRGFFVRHFTGHSDAELTASLREVYVLEGSYALGQSEVITDAIEAALEHYIKIYSANSASHEEALDKFLDCVEAFPRDIYNFSPMTNNFLASIVKDPKLSLAESKAKQNDEKNNRLAFLKISVRNYLFEYIVQDYLDDNEEKIEEYKTFKLQQNSPNLTELLNTLESKHPIMAWNGDGSEVERPLRKVIEEYLKRRVAWQLACPNRHYQNVYLAPDSEFYRVATSKKFNRRWFAEDLTRQLRHRMSIVSPPLTPRESGVSDQPNAHSPSTFYYADMVGAFATNRAVTLGDTPRKSLVAAGSVTQATTVVDQDLMPNFYNIIGFNILHPFYWIDAAGQFVTGNLLQLLCFLIDLCFGDYKTSTVAIFTKTVICTVLVALPARVATFACAKIFSPSGLLEMKDAIQALCHEEVVIESKPLARKATGSNRSQRPTPEPSHNGMNTQQMVNQLHEAESPVIPKLKLSDSPSLAPIDSKSLSASPIVRNTSENSSPSKSIKVLGLPESKNHLALPIHTIKDRAEDSKISLRRHSRSSAQFTFSSSRFNELTKSQVKVDIVTPIHAPEIAEDQTGHHKEVLSIWDMPFPKIVFNHDSKADTADLPNYIP